MASIVAAPRHDSMDVVRGFAVMGILLLNIIAFAMPSAAYINPRAWGGTDPVDLSTWAFMQILFDGKFRGLFSLMFGASILLVMERAAMAGESPRSVHYNRIFWLLLLGLAHHLLLWWGDVLVLYALCGSVAVVFARRSAGSLTKIAFLFFGIHILFCGLFALSMLQMRGLATAPGATAENIRRFAETSESFGTPGSAAIMEEVATYTGSYARIVTHSVQSFVGDFTGSTLFNLFDTIGLMLLGMAMLKSGFLTGSWPTDLYRKTMRHCFLIGFPPMTLLAAWVWHGGFDTLDTFLLFIVYAFPFRIPLIVGYAALFTWVAVAHADHPLVLRVRAVGRTAFSNYLGTSIVMTTIFYGYGLGLFGTVDRAPLYLFVIGAWALMLLWSKPWLDRFAYGPFEWLWRSLARRRLQPMRRTASQ
jgi:uncharacterized protein